MTGGLELLASAVVGRIVPIERARARRIAFTDGCTIFVNESVDVSTPEVRRAVMMQAALLRAGSLDRGVMTKLARNGPVVLDRYLVLELVRSVRGADRFLPRDFVEDLARFASNPVSASPADSFRRARGVEKVAEPLPWFGELRPGAVLRSRSDPAAPAPGVDLQTASEMAAEDESDETDDPRGARSRIMELLSSPMRNPLGDALQRMMGMGRAAGDGPAGAEVPVSGRRAGRVGPGAQQAAGAVSSRIRIGGRLVFGASYPEWDLHRQSYRDGWCRVGAFDPAPDPEAEIGQKPSSRELLRELARLGLEGETHRGETDGDGLDLTALVDLRTRIAAGEGGEPSIYTAHRRTAQRLGVLVLLDATGSTAEETDGGEVFERQRAMAEELTSAMDGLGLRVATYAFYSNGRKNVRFLRCKTFDEPWGLAARRRLEVVRPTGFTRFGAAVRHATQVLSMRAGTAQRLLVVIGDGVAYDDGYEGRYAVADSRRAIAEAADQGVAVVGLSVAPIDGSDPIWAPGQNAVVAEPADLSRVVRDLFRAALLRAGSAPRSFPISETTRSTHVIAGV